MVAGVSLVMMNNVYVSGETVPRKLSSQIL
ncbi:hypothetical protein A2U01_0074667, partial [Trifolium medium]|nr:hypothetical protein [Trifolium medium]